MFDIETFIYVYIKNLCNDAQASRGPPTHAWILDYGLLSGASAASSICGAADDVHGNLRGTLIQGVGIDRSLRVTMLRASVGVEPWGLVGLRRLRRPYHMGMQHQKELRQ